MATTAIDGSTVVFSNSGAAANLTATGSEDGSLSFCFDVLAASGGGTKTTIYSVDDGISGDDNPMVTVKTAFSSYDTDLLYKDGAVNSWQCNGDTSANGAHVWIGTDNKIHYDASGLSAHIQALAVGETFTDTFEYTIKMSNGTLSVGHISVTITGTNDAPVAVADTGSATEDAAVLTGSVAANDSDVDDGATLSYALDAAVAGLTLNPNGSYSFDPSNAAYQHLAQDATTNVVAHYTVTDEHGAHNSSTLTITVTGTNDAPVAVADTGSANEDAAVLTGSVAANDSDVDDGATLSYALDAAVAGLTLNPNGSYSFDPSNAAYQHLAQDATTNVVAHYTVTDEHGAHDSSTLTITVTGTNDAPVAVADTGSATEDAAVLTGSVAANDSDVDDGATLSYALDAAVAGLTLNPNGSYSFDPSNAAYQHLAQDATTNVVTHYTVTDEHGAHNSSTLTITVTGTNDAPVAVADTGSANEDAAVLTGSVAANDSDVDDGATLSYALDAAVAGLTLNPNGSYSFDPSNAAYQHLAQDATTNVVAHYTVTDEHGAHDSSTLTITVTGTNDAPVAVADTGSATEDAAVLTGSVAANDSDVDDGATLSYALDAAVAGLTLNPNGSYSFDPSNAAYQHLAQDATTNVVAHYTVTDEHGAHDSSTLTITVTGTNDAPVAVADTGSATEDAAVLTGSVAANDSDVDDGATLSYALDAAVAGLTLNPNGSYSFDPSNAAYQHLAQDATTNVVAHYTVTDEHGAHNSSTLTITVTGTNDAPVAPTDTNGAANSVTAHAVNGTTVGVMAHSTDPDTGDTLTYQFASGGNPSNLFAIDSSGVVTVNGDLSTGTYGIDVQAVDNNGLAGASSHFTIDVTAPPNGAPTGMTFAMDLAHLNALQGSDGGGGVTNHDIAAGTAMGIFTVSDPDGDTIAYSLGGGASGFSINGSTGVLSTGGSPVGQGTSIFNVVADDGHGHALSHSVAVLVGGNGTNVATTMSSDYNIAYGLGGSDTFKSTAGANFFAGGAAGDTLTTGTLGGTLVGGAAVDQLTAGDHSGGGTIFGYLAVSDSNASGWTTQGGSHFNTDTRDTITNFLAGTDKIDLTQLGHLSVQGLLSGTTIAVGSFGWKTDGSFTDVYVNTSGSAQTITDGATYNVSMEIHLAGNAPITASDFLHG